MLLWQVSQAAVVRAWLGGLPRACDPLWHPEHGPTAWLWSCLTCAHVAVVWHDSQLAVVGGWSGALPGAIPPLWHPMHWRGVPLKRPLVWHDAQSTLK